VRDEEKTDVSSGNKFLCDLVLQRAEKLLQRPKLVYWVAMSSASPARRYAGHGRRQHSKTDTDTIRNVARHFCRDFSGHLTIEKLLGKAFRGDIALPIVRIETSQKAQRGVHLVDLAAYIDKRRAAAVGECRQLCGTA
jgi:hypothetical protein